MPYQALTAVLLASVAISGVASARELRPTAALDQYFFEQTDSSAAFIQIDGKTVYERYAHGFAWDSKQLFWSATKSAMATLVGLALDEGKLRWDESICEALPEQKKKHPALCPITVEHLLFWQSGLKWEESYEKSATSSDVVEMLYGRGTHDMAAYVLDRRVARPPGSGVHYSSGDSNLLASLLKVAYPGVSPNDLLRERLAGPLGLTHFTIESDDSGTLVGSSYLYAAPRDMAAFGNLYLQNGKIGGKRILSEAFIDRVLHKHPRFVYPDRESATDDRLLEGGHWWLNQALKAGSKELGWKNWPADTFAARGHWGQELIVVPSKKLILVRNGDNRQKQAFDPDQMGELLKRLGLL